MKILSFLSLLVYFSVFHININQQIGCLNNANHIHFTCTLYCAPELSIITNILRKKKKRNWKAQKNCFVTLKQYNFFLVEQEIIYNDAATVHASCMNFAMVFTRMSQCDLWGKGRKQDYFFFFHGEKIKRRKNWKMWETSIYCFSVFQAIYSNSHSKQQHDNVIKFKAIFCPVTPSITLVELHSKS